MRYPYYIVSPAYTRTSAGIRVLHRLCHELRLAGAEAYMVSTALNPALNTEQLTPEIVAQHFAENRTPIVIYPETLPGNPLKAPFVVRYILNFPGALGGPKSFDSSEYLVSYAKGMLPALLENEKVLFFPVSDTTVFHPPTFPTSRSGTCYYARKYKYLYKGKLFPETVNSLEITAGFPDSQTPQEIAEIFRNSELFYCYENSALALEATLCGCPAVLLPNEHFSNVIANHELGNNGIAWGTSPEEITRARKTVSRAWESYQAATHRFASDLQRFTEDTQRLVDGRPYEAPLRMLDPFEIISRQTKNRGVRIAKLILTGMILPRDFSELRKLIVQTRSDGLNALKNFCKEREIHAGALPPKKT